MSTAKILKFYKDYDSRWFVDLPDYPGGKEDLEMVMNADVWLDVLSQGTNQVYLYISDQPMLNGETLHYHAPGCTLVEYEYNEGATYHLYSYMGIKYDFKLWLCDVTQFVFGNFPKIIYYKINSN